MGIAGSTVGAGFIPALTPQGIDGIAVGGGVYPRPIPLGGNILSWGIYICFAGFIPALTPQGIDGIAGSTGTLFVIRGLGRG